MKIAELRSFLLSSIFSPLSSVLHRISSVFSPQSSILFSDYCRMALRRLDSESGPLFAQAAIEYRTAADLLAPLAATAVADTPKCRPRHIHRRRSIPTSQ